MYHSCFFLALETLSKRWRLVPPPFHSFSRTNNFDFDVFWWVGGVQDLDPPPPRAVVLAPSADDFFSGNAHRLPDFWGPPPRGIFGCPPPRRARWGAPGGLGPTPVLKFDCPKELFAQLWELLVPPLRKPFPLSLCKFAQVVKEPTIF